MLESDIFFCNIFSLFTSGFRARMYIKIFLKEFEEVFALFGIKPLGRHFLSGYLRIINIGSLKIPSNFFNCLGILYFGLMWFAS